MIRESESFLFGNEKSDDYNIINCNINQNSSDGGLSEPFSANAKIHEITVPKISKNYLQFMERAPLQFTLQLFLDDEWDMDTVNKISRWLIRDTYQPLIFEEEPEKIYDAIFIDDINLLHDSMLHGYLEVTVRCKDYYSHSAVQGNDVDYDFSSGSGSLTIPNLGSMETYPEIWINKIGNGGVSIINTSDNNNTFSFGSAQRASGILTCNGTVYDGELLKIGNDVFEINTGDGTVGTHQNVIGQPAISNIMISVPANFAYGILRWQDGYVQDSQTIAIGQDTYEFDTDGIYSKNNICVDISKYCTTASYKYNLDNSPLNKFNIFTQSLTIQNQIYNFEQGTDTQIMKVNHGIPVDIDPDVLNTYRVINVGLYSEFQKYPDPTNLANGYVDRTIFDYMQPIAVLDNMHLAVPNLDQSKQGVGQYITNSQQAPYSDTNKQEINVYLRQPALVQLVTWQNDGAVLYVPDGTVPSTVHKGSVLELQSNNIYNSTGAVAYTGRTFYVGVQKIETGLSWHNVAISKIYLMSYGNGNNGSDYPQIENDLPYTEDKDNNIIPKDLWYTDSGTNGLTYPSDFTFPCNRWEISLTRTANTTITAVINHINTGNSPNTDSHSLALLPADLTKSNTVQCGLTMDDTMKNLADAINASATIAGSEYSTDITTANKYVSAQKMDTDTSSYGVAIPYVLLTSKLAGTDGNNIQLKFTNNITGIETNDYLNGGHGCSSADAQRELVRAMVKNYQLNPNFTDNINKYYPVYTNSSGQETRITADSNTWTLVNESDYNTMQLWIKVRAMINGSKGNDILVASNCSVCSWANQPDGTLTISFVNGSDPNDIPTILNAIATTINAHGNGYSASVINNSQIEITYNTVGEIGNIPVSTTCFNISFDSYQLNGGLDELQNGELVYVNCKKGEEHIESSLQIPRYDNSNLNFLKLIYGNNNLEVQGSCKIRILYEYRYR